LRIFFEHVIVTVYQSILKQELCCIQSSQKNLAHKKRSPYHLSMSFIHDNAKTKLQELQTN